MTIQEAEKELALAKERLAVAQGSVSFMEKKLYDLKLSKAEPGGGVLSKFKLWVDSNMGTEDHVFLIHIETSSGVDLFEYDGFFRCERREVITLNDLLERFSDSYDDQEELDYHELTTKDLDEWMLELMRIGFKSMTYDW